MTTPVEKTMAPRTVKAIFLIFALAYLVTDHRTPYPLSYLVKAVPIFALALLTGIGAPGTKHRLVAAGLAVSGCGDVVLGLPANGVFVYGLGLFLVAQSLYIVAFIRNPRLEKRRIATALGFVIYGSVTAAVLWPKLGPMRVPVMGYLCVITAMGISAALGKENSGRLVAGAALFILSDSLIAVNRFLVPLPAAGFWIMLTYYPAQWLIAAGVQRDAGPVPNPDKGEGNGP